MLKNLIIGKNSKVVQQLTLDPDRCDVISHREIGNIDVAQYDRIFVFSFPRMEKQISCFNAFIGALPAEKVIFVSTIAVLALQKRKQWNFYPNAKLALEGRVLQNGGAVLRLGIFAKEPPAGLFGTLPLSTPTLVSASLDWRYEQSKIYHAIELKNIPVAGFRSHLARICYRIATFLPTNPALQVPLEAICKLTGLKYYGYTADALNYFTDRLQIGFGALGSVFGKYNQNVVSSKIIANSMSDLELNENGFLNTQVGRHLYGLGRKWHGVYMEETPEENYYRKKVPYFVKRPTLKSRFSEVGHVETLRYRRGTFWETSVRRKDGTTVQFFSNRVALAAGPTENIRLLSHFAQSPITASDHETAYVGMCELDDALRNNLISRNLSIFIRPKFTVRSTNNAGVEFIFECRPYVSMKDRFLGDGQEFYNESTIRIAFRLIRKFSISRINEAFFNKFGIGFATSQLNLFVQCVAKDAITFSNTDGPDFYKQATRTRLTSDCWNDIADVIQRLLPSFQRVRPIESFDSLHILGGKQLLDTTEIQQLTKRGALTIIGSPSERELDARHHTVSLQDDIRKSSPLLLYCPVKSRSLSPHYEMAQAILFYRGNEGDRLVNRLIDVVKSRRNYKQIFIQKTALSNLLLVPFLRACGWHIVYYVHEPLTLRNRLRKGVPFFKAMAVDMIHSFEVPFCHMLVTGNRKNEAYKRKQLHFAPLLYPPTVVSLPWTRRSSKILYFGRLDDEKYCSKFLAMDVKKRVIATENLNVRTFHRAIRRYSEAQKNRFFEGSKFVWAVEKHNLSQSGVVVDAIRAGCVLVLKCGDPLIEKLHRSRFVTIRTPPHAEELRRVIAAYEAEFPSGPIWDGDFEHIAGRVAYRDFWENLIG